MVLSLHYTVKFYASIVSFLIDNWQVMEILMSLQGSQMEADDPTISYMLQVEMIFKFVRYAK